jgi:hypothetical protein
MVDRQYRIELLAYAGRFSIYASTFVYTASELQIDVACYSAFALQELFGEVISALSGYRLP